jgi:hypothetical protein
MRELVKSVVGFSLARSLLGMEQMRNLLREKKDKDEKREDWIKEDLEAVSDAAGERFGDRAQKVFDAGNRFQRETIDLLFDIFKSDDAKPKRFAELAADMAEKSASALREAVEEKKECPPKHASGAQEETPKPSA